MQTQIKVGITTFEVNNVPTCNSMFGARCLFLPPTGKDRICMIFKTLINTFVDDMSKVTFYKRCEKCINEEY